jgi:signal peptidase II
VSWVLVVSAALVLVLDQASKHMVVRRLALGQAVGPRWLRIRHARNPGRGPSFCAHPLVLLIAWGLALTCAVVLIQTGQFFQRPAAQAGLGAALGGAAGNLYDRIRRGAIIDFVDLGWWPVFNLADAAITVGAVVALIWIR